MFICRECLSTTYANEYEPLGASFGPCEVCGEVRHCSDIHHSLVKFKRSWAEQNLNPELLEWARDNDAIGEG